MRGERQIIQQRYQLGDQEPKPKEPGAAKSEQSFQKTSGYQSIRLHNI